MKAKFYLMNYWVTYKGDERGEFDSVYKSSKKDGNDFVKSMRQRGHSIKGVEFTTIEISSKSDIIDYLNHLNG